MAAREEEEIVKVLLAIGETSDANHQDEAGNERKFVDASEELTGAERVIWSIANEPIEERKRISTKEFFKIGESEGSKNRSETSEEVEENFGGRENEKEKENNERNNKINNEWNNIVIEKKEIREIKELVW